MSVRWVRRLIMKREALNEAVSEESVYVQKIINIIRMRSAAFHFFF